MIDKLDPTPLYVQVADAVQREIEAGRPGPGEPIASESYMGQTYGVARGTVRRAVALLVERGLVVTIQGRGSYVKR
ncbi:MAG: GntR family transcriptional regulator [Chloroflexota bacterium]